MKEKFYGFLSLIYNRIHVELLTATSELLWEVGGECESILHWVLHMDLILLGGVTQGVHSNHFDIVYAWGGVCVVIRVPLVRRCFWNLLKLSYYQLLQLFCFNNCFLN